MFGLGKRVEKLDCLINKAFSIILYRTSISSLCLVYVNTMVAVTAKIAVLKIEYYLAGSIASRNMPKVSFWNCDTASELESEFVSQATS